MNELTLSYQTRIETTPEGHQILQECANLLSRVERKLFAAVAKGEKSAAYKNEFLKGFGITARQFNGCRVSIDGKIAACQAGQELAIISLTQQIKALEKKIKLLEKKPSKRFVLHQKKRRVAMLRTRLAGVKSDKQAKRVRLCFGGKKLFRAQFYLEKNGFSSKEEWKKAWQDKRNSEFFLLGSKDERAGNQSCTATVQRNGKITLRVRLPRKLESNYGKYLLLEDVSFAHGQQALISALAHPEGQAISYRFKRDEKGWRVFASTTIKKAEIQSIEGSGVIGLDLNVDHIAYVETDRFGNPIIKKNFSWSTNGRSKEQLKALTGDLCKEIVELAIQAKKPLVIEKLDFQKKKMALREESSKKFCRILSSFAYGLFFNALTVRAYKHGVTVRQVNPAFTSVIGRVNYATRYGLSVHLAAALCIARRDLNYSESPSPFPGRIPDGKGGHLAFVLPVRNRTKPVWFFWGQVKKKIKTALVAHHQARNRSSSPLGSCDSKQLLRIIGGTPIR